MTRFLQPEWLWLMGLLPHRDAVARPARTRSPPSNIPMSSLARDVARRSRSRIGVLVWLLPILAGVLMIVGARPPATRP